MNLKQYLEQITEGLKTVYAAKFVYRIPGATPSGYLAGVRVLGAHPPMIVSVAQTHYNTQLRYTIFDAEPDECKEIAEWAKESGAVEVKE